MMSNDLDTNAILLVLRELRQRIDVDALDKHLRSDGMLRCTLKRNLPKHLAGSSKPKSQFMEEKNHNIKPGVEPFSQR